MQVTSIFSISDNVFNPPLSNEINSIFSVTCILSSANAFNFDQSKILLLGEELSRCVKSRLHRARITCRQKLFPVYVFNPLPRNRCTYFDEQWEEGIRKLCLQREKMLVTSIFSNSKNVFYLII